MITVTTIETGGIGANSYQWYSSPDGSTWSVAAGASNGQNYQPGNLTSKTYYRKAIINSCRTAYTNTVTTLLKPAELVRTHTSGTALPMVQHGPSPQEHLTDRITSLEI